MLLARLGCVGFTKRQTVLVKPDAKSLGINSKSTVHSVHATSCKYPGKQRTIAGKIQVKPQHQRSPYAVKFEDRSHEETERQKRCARSKASNLAKNIFKLKEDGKAAFQFPAEEWVLHAASTKELEEKRVCGRFRSEYAYGQQARP